jgi:chemotaxis protein MotB
VPDATNGYRASSVRIESVREAQDIDARVSYDVERALPARTARRRRRCAAPRHLNCDFVDAGRVATALQRGDRMKTFVAILAAACITGCVSQGKYDRAVARTETTRAELARKNAELDESNRDRLAMQFDLSARHAEIAKLKGELASLGALSAGQSEQSRARIVALQARLGELEAAQRASEGRAALYRDLSTRLKRQIDDGNLALVLRDGRMVLQLPNDVLFDTGRTELKAAGKEALSAVAEVMTTMRGRQFQVAGHTDNVPIHNDRFASNWELSSGRALRVVHYLMGSGVDGAMLSAAGYSEIDPVASNDSAAGRKQNRRTEITLQPNIDELVKVP